MITKAILKKLNFKQVVQNEWVLNLPGKKKIIFRAGRLFFLEIPTSFFRDVRYGYFQYLWKHGKHFKLYGVKQTQFEAVIKYAQNGYWDLAINLMNSYRLVKQVNDNRLIK